MKHLEREEKEKAGRIAADGCDGAASGSSREAAAMLAWFARSRRELPWREDRDPYRVLVSEIMLQQTRVDVVIPRYREFLLAFPTLESLASASREAVHQHWSGLGYYRRADWLHEAARAIVARGAFPRTVPELRELPGLGAYTSAAVASIAFEECVPVLDGNVERLLARWTCEEEEPRRAAARRRLQATAASLLDPTRPGDSNQALMELGALVCTPSSPDCPSCPISARCCARRSDRQGELPRRGQRRSRRKRVWIQFAVVAPPGTAREKRILLVRRDGDRRRLAGRWELPGMVVDAEPGRVPVRAAAARWEVTVGVELGRFSHSITDTDYRVLLLSAALRAGDGSTVEEDPDVRWAPLEAFDEGGRWTRSDDPLPTSSILAKAIRLLRTS